MQDKKKIFIIGGIVLGFIILGVSSYFLFAKVIFKSKDSVTNNNQTVNNSNNNQATNNTNYIPEEYKPESIQKYLTVYLCETNGIAEEISYTSTHPRTGGKCSEYYKIGGSENIKFLNEDYYYSPYYKDFLLYEDNGLKLYNNLTKKSIKIPLTISDYQSIFLNVNEEEDGINGLFLRKPNNYYSYYNLNKNVILYDYNKFTNISTINNNYIEGTTEIDGDFMGQNSFVLKINEEKEIGSIITGTCGSGFEELETKGGNYIIFGDNCDEMALYDAITFYTTDNLKPINKEPLNSNQYFLDDFGNLNMFEDYVFYIYNPEGKIIKNYTLEDKVLAIYKNFYLSISNNTLYLKDYQNNIIKELGPWTDDSEFKWTLSGQFEDYNVQYGNESSIYPDKDFYNNGKGFYFIITTPTKTYEYYYNPDNNQFNSWIINETISGYSNNNKRIQY